MLDSITFEALTPDTFKRLNLTPFVRYQETTTVYYLKGDHLKSKHDSFIDDWDDERKLAITHHLKNVVHQNGHVILVRLDQTLIGFSSLEPTLFNGYLELSFFHVSKPYRHLGIGRTLFKKTSECAKLAGASKLYIGAHPSIHTQKFYESVGCVLTKHVNEDIYNREPLDIQLEFDLSILS